ncbi:peroxide stress protein YaaA [Rhodococcus chondri]|uniref:Peroxide stress protein YaaA n=1 Tax=Rhodococcus chondri TaxID=3065941 RepID=A0ABU7JY74_9NOCA|nr:peroxide stress protein YaaA [Rhodococcus sp. CC-R104]MEE2034969.1 peroxide stress protein YaaA [Rhodococcus sp. CC-R104]
MLVLLPPSETKSDGGVGEPLDLGELSMPQLTPTRELLVQALVDLAADSEASMRALGLGATQGDEVERNAKLWVSPTRPALERYTGVLFDALDAASFTRAQREKAYRRLAIGSALFGAVRAGDPIPAYRLSGGSKVPGFGTLAALWRPELPDALVREADGDLVVDLRSGIYQQLGPVPGAVTATVLTEQADGSRKVVSHFNKHHKGLLARALVLTRAEPADVKGVARVAAKAGLRVETRSPTELLVLT